MSRTTRLKQSLGIRTKPSTNLPIEFMQDHVTGDLSPAVASPPLQYATEVSAFVRTERKKELETVEGPLFEEAKAELEELKEAVAQYHKKTKAHAPIDVRTSNWAGVQQAIQAAALEEGSDDESNMAKSSCSKMARSIPYFEVWLGLLPDGDYGSVVSGVFKMIVSAAKRANDVRIAIFKALAEIPESVARAVEYRTLYEDTKPQELIQKTAQLCKAILIALRHVMIYFTEGMIKGSVKAMFQGSAYKKNLQTHLDDVKELATKIDQEALVRSQHSVRYIEKNVERIQQELVKLQSCSKSVQVDETTLQDIVTRIGHLLEEKLVNSTFSHFSSIAAIGPRNTNVPQDQLLLTSTSSANLAPSSSVIDKQTLLAILDTSDTPASDLQHCLDNGRLLSFEDQDRVKWIMRSDRFRKWLNHASSKSILINGNAAGNETFSPTTFLSAKLLETLGNIEQIVTCKYFCSLHATSIDDDRSKEGPIGMIKSFITQLLVRQDTTWDLAFLTREDVTAIENNNNDNNNLSTLCSTLSHLIHQLPATTLVFWAIDNATFYERSEWRPAFLEAIEALLDIMASGGQHVVIKLLTCHGRSSFVKEFFDDEEVLLAPAAVNGDCQGWNDRVWRTRVEEELGGSSLEDE